MTAHPSDWRDATSRTKGLAALALVLITGGVALTSIFSAAASRVVGPALIAQNTAGETLLANSDTLFVVAADEHRFRSVPGIRADQDLSAGIAQVGDARVGVLGEIHDQENQDR